MKTLDLCGGLADVWHQRTAFPLFVADAADNRATSETPATESIRLRSFEGKMFNKRDVIGNDPDAFHDRTVLCTYLPSEWP